MTKLASRLPDSNGLSLIADALVQDPTRRHLAIGSVDCSKVTTDYSRGDVEPTARFRMVEIVDPVDATTALALLRRAYDHRHGATTLPIHIEDEISAALTVRGEDITTDLANDTRNLTDEQTEMLAASLDAPLRHEVARAIDVLRGAKEWVALGRARRVLQLALRRLEENDLRLLRDDEGNLVDPATGEVVDEEQITSEDIDRMLAALDDSDDEQGEGDADEDGKGTDSGEDDDES